MIAAGASVFYAICFLALAIGFFLYKKSEKKYYGMTWLALTIVMILCYQAFVAAIINLVHIPVNLVTLSVFNLAAAAFFWFQIYKKKEMQKYKFSFYDVIFFVLLIVAVAVFAKVRYGGMALNWSYKTVDPAPRFREAMEFVNGQSVSRMFFAQLVNGVLIEFLGPWKNYDYYYQFYVLGDLIQLIVSGMMFYGVIRRFFKNHFLSIAGVIASFIYLLGYPLNSTIYGFTYLGMSLYMIAMLLVLTDNFMEDEGNKWFNIILLMLGCHAMFQCYAMFMPVVFLAIGLALLLKQKRKGILFSKDTLITGLAIFLLPVVLGMIYTYMDVFVSDGVSVGSAISTEGAIYRDLYSNFLAFIPLAVFGFIKLIKSKKNHFLSWFTPIFVMFVLGLFVMGYHNKSVSTYYFYKNYYLLWMLAILLGFYALYEMKKEARLMAVLYMGSWAFAVMMFATGLENRIEANNQLYVVSNKSQMLNDLLCFNMNTSKEGPYAENRMELAHFAYGTLMEGGVTEKTIPCAYDWDQTYLYEAMTGQDLSDYKYWEDGYDAYFANLEANCDYVCVLTDSVIYRENTEYFDSLEQIFVNDIGFVAAVHEQ